MNKIDVNYSKLNFDKLSGSDPFEADSPGTNNLKNGAVNHINSVH